MSKEIIILTSAGDIDADAWNALVDESPVATWFQTPEAYAFFEGLSFLEAFAVAVENGGQLKGVVMGYVQKDGGRIKQFFSRRAIITGGPLLANDISDEELTALLNATKQVLKRKAIYVETRNFNDYSRWRKVFEKCGFAYEPHLDFIVDCVSEDVVWNNLKENRRRQIKRAKKDGVVFVEASNEEGVLAFYELLRDLYKSKVKSPLFPIEFFVSFYRKGYGKFFLIKDNDAIIGGIMCPIFNNRCIYEWFVCGLDVDFKHKYPSVMATWAAIEYACNNHIMRFDFMGAGKPDDGGYGVRDFKSKFGGKLVEYGRYVYICKPWLYRVGKIGIKILKGL